MDRLRLIAEVRQRPILWDFHRLNRSRQEIKNKWQDVASSMGDNVSVSDCKSMWKHLRNAYYEGKKRCGQRLSKDKSMGLYDPANKYYGNTHKYAKQMNFLEKIVKPEKQKFQHDSQTQELYLFSIRSTSSKPQESEAKSYTSNNEHTLLTHDDTDNIRVKQEPKNEIAMEPYHLDHNESNSVNSNNLNDREKSEKEFKSIPIKQNNNITAAPSTHYINDPDYNFLISFSSHMKSMTPLQNLQFRAKMADMILNILKSCNSATETNKPVNNILQLKALVDISDPDGNFLISFMLYMKMLTTLQNLQLRSKISELMLNILSKNCT
ncbi:uncharacterized protein LOC119608745 [Lucilia sericata]|uniref:uncharacterized protein LOC119608745 n=1 Tax=Lucilia sericata TaxID=13632 RepID=UPI0018A7F2F4|nr:uncharacterized protein LOC119608745 [Lucilia sericata]